MEELFQRYRAELVHSIVGGQRQTSSATANLRVTVVAQFYRWAQKNGYPTHLGAFLLQRDRDGDRRLLGPRVIYRHPRMLSTEEIRALFKFVRQPYLLALRWALVTGLRRFEIANLRVSDLPNVQQMALTDDGMSTLRLVRKGGREMSVYAPNSLIEETNWYVLVDRKVCHKEFSQTLFINRLGRPLSRQALTREFRRCADLIGSDATLHHLRHTYAINVLRYLDDAKKTDLEESRNSLKILQVLLGHARSETTEIYLKALQITGGDVLVALEGLYGASHGYDA